MEEDEGEGGNGGGGREKERREEGGGRKDRLFYVHIVKRVAREWNSHSFPLFLKIMSGDY